MLYEVITILRLDPFGLRRLLPRALIEWAYPRLARLVTRGLQLAEGAGSLLAHP